MGDGVSLILKFMSFENNFIPTSSIKIQNTPLTKVFHDIGERNFLLERLCGDADFSEAFVRAVPDPEEQKKFLIHSARFDKTGRSDCDLRYVLFFRRTLPSKTPKHEERWTNNYLGVLTGLKREIPHGPHRAHSIILCDSFAHLLTHGERTEDAEAFTDNEIVVNFPEYDQEDCLLKFKPSIEKKGLHDYLQTEGALSEEAILREVQENRRNNPL